MNMNPMNEQDETEPDWLGEVITVIQLTDGVNDVTWKKEEKGYVVFVDYGGEMLSFEAGTDGERKGVQYDFDGSVHDMTEHDMVLWWVAGELLERLKMTRQRAREREELHRKQLIERNESCEEFERRLKARFRVEE